ncbi:splicing factor YJU2-like [Nematostella vectensis]|uniref:splicing factor YJU2-like n=1 Tax=Nematostella vectensis TaxID=45351 RepID=UPI0020771490|nr:splicing factor YJU2-like [Nematostella vectensis]
MSERKVLNKYYPPDFDPSKIPKLKLPKDRQYVVRLMAPFNMRCTTCGEYIYKGKKFNARKETVQGETYLGLYIFRFYIRCPRCISEITFKTDPENTDYVCENGATRNFQAHRMAEKQEEKMQQEREEEEANNPMKALENRTKESKQEMDILEKLEELKDLNTRHANVDYASMLETYAQEEEKRKQREQQEDDDLVKSVFGGNKIQRRLSDSDSDDENNSNDSANMSSSALTGRKRATDILTEGEKEAMSSEPITKKAKPVWEQSVGNLSNKTSLSSLVKVKKASSTPLAKSTASAFNPSEGENKNTSQLVKPVKPVEQSNSTQQSNRTQQSNSGQTLGANSLGMLGDYGSSEESD